MRPRWALSTTFSSPSVQPTFGPRLDEYTPAGFQTGIVYVTEEIQMNGDFSRVTFDPGKHYSSVLLQQGRVQLDADANEQAALGLYQLRAALADIIGPYAGSPVDSFMISLKQGPKTNRPTFWSGPATTTSTGFSARTIRTTFATCTSPICFPATANIRCRRPFRSLSTCAFSSGW